MLRRPAYRGPQPARLRQGHADRSYIEQQVRSGRITVAAAACVGEVLADPALQRVEDDWVGWAHPETTQAPAGSRRSGEAAVLKRRAGESAAQPAGKRLLVRR